MPLWTHGLEVEIGRWKRPVKVAYAERKCRVCGVLEDEFHFLFECPIYVNLRAKYIKRYYYISPSMYKALFSLSRFSSPVHPGLTNRGKPGRTVANRGRTVAAPWTTGANRGEPG